MTQANDNRSALVNEIGQHYSYYFNHEIRPMLLVIWSEMSEHELTRICANWRAVRIAVERHRAGVAA